MNKIFLAYSYRPANEPLAAEIENLIESHRLVAVTGKVLGGDPLPAGVRQRIQDADALVALMTREDAANGATRWTPAGWVRDELVTARARGQRAIAIVEGTPDLGGLLGDDEYIPLDRQDRCPAIIKLSQTIGLWKELSGRSIEVRLLPADAAKMAATDTAVCRYRVIQPGAPAGVAVGGWQAGRVRRKPGGVFLLIQGVRATDEIEVQIEAGGSPRWRSEEAPQWIHVELASLP